VEVRTTERSGWYLTVGSSESDPFRADQFRRQNQLLTYMPVNRSPLAPPSVTGSFTPDLILRCCPASAQSMKPAAWFSRPSTDLPLFLIPHPLRFEIGPQISRGLRRRVLTVSKAGLFVPRLSSRKNFRSFRPSGLLAKLSPSEHLSWSFADLPS